MITDKFLRFSNAQAITADAASTDYLDSTVAQIGDGDGLRLVVTVGTAFDNLTSLAIKLQSDDNSSFSSASDDATVTVLLAALTAGAKVVDIPLPRGLQRYVRVYYDVTGTAPSAGTVTAQIVQDSDTGPSVGAYASGFTTGY